MTIKDDTDADSDVKQKNVSEGDDVSLKKSFCNNLFIPWKTLIFLYFSSIFVLGATVVFLDIITGWWGLNYLDYLLILGVFGFISWVFY